MKLNHGIGNRKRPRNGWKRTSLDSKSGGEFHFGRADWPFPLAVAHCSTTVGVELFT